MFKLYVVKKRHEQVEKTLEMKKNRVGMALQKVIKQGRNVYMMFSQCNTCSMVIYLTILEREREREANH